MLQKGGFCNVFGPDFSQNLPFQSPFLTFKGLYSRLNGLIQHDFLRILSKILPTFYQNKASFHSSTAKKIALIRRLNENTPKIGRS